MISAITQKSNPRNIKWIVVHCTAGHQNETVDALLAGFKARGWKKPGYHYIVKANGEVVELLTETSISNGVAGFNSNSIHISYLGGIDAAGKPVDNRTIDQKAALLSSLKILKQKYPAAIIKGHRDFSPDTNKNGKVDYWERIKACPCFDAMIEFAGLG